MRRILLYATCAAAVALAVWLVAGTRESSDPLSGATQMSGTQASDAAGAGGEAPAIVPAAHATESARAAAEARARSPQASSPGPDAEQAARSGPGTSPAAGPDEPQRDGAIDAAPGAIAPAPSNAPRVLRSLGEGEPPAPDTSSNPRDGSAPLPMGFAPQTATPAPTPQDLASVPSVPSRESTGNNAPAPAVTTPQQAAAESGDTAPPPILDIISEDLKANPPGQLPEVLPGANQ